MKRRVFTHTCSKGHVYDADEGKWCPKCGEVRGRMVRSGRDMDATGPMLLTKIEKALRIRFRDACHNKGRTMRNVMMDFMERYSSANGFPVGRVVEEEERFGLYGPLPGPPGPKFPPHKGVPPVGGGTSFKRPWQERKRGEA